MDNKMQHIDYDSLIMRYLSGEADIDEKNELFSAISSDETIRHDFFKLKRLYNLTAELQAHDYDSSSAYKDFLQKTTGETKIVALKTNTLKYSLQIAASVAVLLGAWFLYTRLDKKPHNIEFAAQNEMVEKSLSDNSIISINKHSKIAYDESFGKETRLVQLEGEAFFEVTHDKQHPFIVKTADIIVTDLGTKFNINSNLDNSKIIVTVESGIVKVEDIAKKQEVIVKQGEKAEFNKKDKTLRKTINESYNYSAWKTKTLIFKDARLIDVVSELEHYYNTKIELKNPNLNTCVLNAKYEQYSIDSVFEMLQLTFNISVTKQNNTYSITGEGCGF